MDPIWLREQIEVLSRTFQEVADEIGHRKQYVMYHAKKHGIKSNNPAHPRQGKFLGNKSPLWKGGTHRYVYNWFDVSESFKKLANYTCNQCGIKPSKSIDVHVHHIDGSCQNNHPSNIVVLCRSCHYSGHSKMRGGKPPL